MIDLGTEVLASPPVELEKSTDTIIARCIAMHELFEANRHGHTRDSFRKMVGISDPDRKVGMEDVSLLINQRN